MVHAAAALDADGLVAPAAAVIEAGRIIAIGRPESIGEAGDARTERLPEDLLIPVLVNAHVHLDLWSVGEVSIERGFDNWLAEVRVRRPVDQDAIASSVEAGIAASIDGGVGAVGDIAGAFGLTAASVFSQGPLAGTSFIEVFGIGRRRDEGLAAIRRVAEIGPRVGAKGRIGLSPHAPYSCAPEVFAAAAATGLPLATHLAETPEEARFLRNGEGPLVELLRRVGSLGPDDHCPSSGLHPVDQLAMVEPRRPWLAAHVNYLAEPDEPEEILRIRASRLREREITVVYCPRATRFLGHPRPGRPSHPWSFLRAHGVRVALGTDGRPCLDRGDRLSTLDDVRLLVGEGADPATAIAMATVDGAIGLGLDPGAVRFRDGAEAGLLAVRVGTGDPVRGLVASEDRPRWVVPLCSAAFGPSSRWSG